MLKEQNINHFYSLKELIKFSETYQDQREKMISHHYDLISSEMEDLNIQIPLLEQKIKDLNFQKDFKIAKDREDPDSASDVL